MANPQKENGYTAIANELLDRLIGFEFPPKTSLPQRLCWFVIRKTYGYHKKMDIISLSQFQKATNEKNRTNLVYWLNYLVQARILVKIKKSNNEVEYGFNKDYDQWLPLVQARTLVQARSYGSASTDTKTSASTDTHKRKKEINTKEIAETSSAPFSLKEEIQKLEDSPRRDLNIIGFYLSERKPDIRTKAQLSEAIKRHLRSAKSLSTFEDDQIVRGFKRAKEQTPEWTLETCYKLLTK